VNGREKENEGTFATRKTTERLAKTGANESDDTHLPYKISAKRFPPSAPVPPVLPFPFWACRLPLGSSYITFLHCSVPHLSFPFPPAPTFPFDKLIRFLCLVINSLDACLWKGQLLPPSHSITLTFWPNQSSSRPTQRLHPSPSLPNLW
jgi:hypothetical protein